MKAEPVLSLKAKDGMSCNRGRVQIQLEVYLGRLIKQLFFKNFFCKAKMFY